MPFSISDRLKLLEIHAEVGKQYTYVEDIVQFKTPELWAVGDYLYDFFEKEGRKFGDCDEFAITYMKKAMLAGFDARLVMLFVDGDLRKGHLICEVTTKKHDEALYLDNRFGRPVSIHFYRNDLITHVSPWNPQPRDKRPWQYVIGI